MRRQLQFLMTSTMLGLVSVASAQIGGFSETRVSQGDIDPDKAPIYRFPLNLSFGYHPVIRFKQGSFLDTEASLFWVERFFQPAKSISVTKTVKDEKQTLLDSIGGWFAFKGANNAWQLHLRHNFSESLAIQTAVLGGRAPRLGGRYDFSLFAIFSRSLAKSTTTYAGAVKGENGFRVAVGLGAYYYKATTGDVRPTVFGQVQYYLDNGFTIDASAWYVQKPRFDSEIYRYGIGFGFRF